MYNWFQSLVGAPVGLNDDSVVSGAVLASLACLIFILWTFSRLFRK